MSTLRESLADYLALRRSLGFKLGRQGKLLAQLVERLDDLGQEHLTVEYALGVRDVAGVRPGELVV